MRAAECAQGLPAHLGQIDNLDALAAQWGLCATSGKLGVAAATPPASVDAIPMSDGSLDHASRITDDESMRFALPVDLRASQLENVHNGGATYVAPSGLELQLLRQQKLRLVNLGPANLSRQGEWGYPICTVCGAARSLMSPDTEKLSFVETHQKSCGQVPVPRALFADVRVDGLRLRGQASMADAANLCEALLLGARDLLDMVSDDTVWSASATTTPVHGVALNRVDS